MIWWWYSQRRKSLPHPLGGDIREPKNLPLLLSNRKVMVYSGLAPVSSPRPGASIYRAVIQAWPRAESHVTPKGNSFWGHRRDFKNALHQLLFFPSTLQEKRERAFVDPDFEGTQPIRCRVWAMKQRNVSVRIWLIFHGVHTPARVMTPSPISGGSDLVSQPFLETPS